MNGYVLALAIITFALFAFSIALIVTNRDLRQRLDIQRKNTKHARAETEYWLLRAGNFQSERDAYRKGLDNVIALRTVNMASIGRRMAVRATAAIEVGERLKALGR